MHPESSINLCLPILVMADELQDPSLNWMLVFIIQIMIKNSEEVSEANLMEPI